MSKRNRRRGGAKQPTPIDLSKIRSTSTCIELNLPSQLACQECNIDPLAHKQKKRKTQRIQPQKMSPILGQSLNYRYYKA